MSPTRFLLALLIGLAFVSIAAGAGARAQAEAGAADRSGAPVPAKGKGDKCVAPTDWMRRNHMTALKHQRDDTVHEGVRTAPFSLKACVECHAVSGDGGRPVSVDSPKHFCRTCHDYAAVSIDCFECHASRPGETDKKAALPDGAHGDAELKALTRYVEEHAR